ncbi:MaoC/PaaZ C-terminal domain-containing protein [Rhodococcus jostii]|uniref:Acyl dehydratase n=1 Tax=Rhodococcus jostii TaxID=132919 RepID=A0A1H5H7I7_RHOJO|nr:MaoC/PaaZ C-terminal domain-containing protein [Rhodococcus jostii]SEE23909.1 Acyl dehydratase [Rhodococcus jostii]
MTLDLQAVGRSAGPDTVSWTSFDALLYALGVGAGQDDSAQELEFTTENTEGVPQQVLPTYAIVLAQRAPGLKVDIGDVDRTKVVHAGQGLIMHRPLPVEGKASLTNTVTGIYDKGSGALVRTSAEAVDLETGEKIFTTEGAIFIRGAGGFGGPQDPAAGWSVPEGEPDQVVSAATRSDQALLYRLSGDRNPLHSDPAFAARGGFTAPILHGLCTFGVSARVVLRAIGVAADQLASIDGRFSKPVLPGERLTVSVWSDGKTHLFRTTNSSGETVLDRGVLTTR